MNIKQIAQDVAQETDWKDAGEFLHRCLSKLAEQDEEIERLKEEGGMPVKYYQPDGKGPVYAVYGSSSINFTESLLNELAASQAREVLLREAMDDYFNQYPAMMKGYILDAIDQPTDTTALEAMIAKAGEVMRERCATATAIMHCEGGISLEDATQELRALPAITLDDLK